MDQARKTDVVVVARDHSPTTMSCLESVLLHSGSALGRLIVIDLSPARDVESRHLNGLAARDGRIQVTRPSRKVGEVEACNLGIHQRQGDVVVLLSDAHVCQDWLAELSAVAYAEARTACVSPLGPKDDVDIPSFDKSLNLDEIEHAVAREACEGLPPWSAVPIPEGACCYLRSDVLGAVGDLNPELPTIAHALVDWHLRAQGLGFMAKRANHVFIRRMNSYVDATLPEEDIDQAETLLIERHPHLQNQLVRFHSTLDRALADHAISLRGTGRLRIAYDLRTLPREQVGTRTYAVSLVKALAAIPEVDLTLLVREPSQAKGLDGRVVTTEDWADDVAVIHRPMQVLDPRELRLLYESSAHLVLTYQDLIGYRIPQVFPTDAEHQSYRATSCLSLQGIQRILAYSEAAAREIVEEFGIPREDVVVVPLGVDAEGFAARGPRDNSIRDRLKLPRRYFFSIATDFPHKNLPCLLEAYALLRERWTHGVPPGLILAGYATSARNAFYQQLAAQSRQDGAVFLGAVSPDQLRVLYQGAEALIFPSLYEGFGLPPLEAMAAGTPVIAMPISSVPEVGGDCVLYPESFSPEALSQAMERLLSDKDLQSSLKTRGLERAASFCWEETARRTLEVYRSAILQPSARSVAMRRLLREAILNWSGSVVESHTHTGATNHQPIIAFEPPGIRVAWKALNAAVSRRLRREVKRFDPRGGRRSA